METYLFEFSSDQASAVRAALNLDIRASLDRIRQSISADFLTADELQMQVRLDLRFLRPALAALMRMAEQQADAHLAELSQVMAEYRDALHALRENEREVAAWNARAEEEKNRHSAAAVTA
ncbi:MAG: hypothetical protein ACM3ZA_10300 [Bacillota bacterium]